MTATLSMVPLAQIRPSEANPRADFESATQPPGRTLAAPPSLNWQKRRI